MAWPLFKRKRYETDVLILIPGLGIDIRVAGEEKTRGVIDVAWKQRFSTQEAALLVAHSTVVGLYAHGDRAKSAALLYDRIEPIHAAWKRQGVIRTDLADRWLAESIGIVGQKAIAGAAPTAIQFRVTAELPNIVGRKPSRIFRFHSYAAWFLKDLPEVGHGSALESKDADVVYPYTLAITRESTKELTHFVGLRGVRGEGTSVWFFQQDGSRKQWQNVEQLLHDEEAFISNALTLVCRELNLPETWEEMRIA